MRLSRPDENDSSKRRHFEISIDSPFNILSCRATQANISLPAYSAGGLAAPSADEYDCGCPGAALLRRNTPPSGATLASTGANANASSSSTNLPGQGVSRSWTNDDGGLALPSQAHFANDPNSGTARPIHLMRVPSFNPPGFDEDDPPPPLVTPPPLYDNVVDDPRDALADYFSRLADEEEERSDRSRIDVPLTPGGRVNRSMDISRTWVPLGGATRPAESSMAH